MERSPPKQFDTFREVFVYNGYFQFVELELLGCKLASRTIRLPKHILELAKDTDQRLRITASCKLFGNARDTERFFERAREFERELTQLRKAFLKPLGGDRRACRGLQGR